MNLRSELDFQISISNLKRITSPFVITVQKILILAADRRLFGLSSHIPRTTTDHKHNPNKKHVRHEGYKYAKLSVFCFSVTHGFSAGLVLVI